MSEWKRLALFLFEGAMLKKTWRTGYAFLGKGRESVAAHSFGVMLIAMILGEKTEGVAMERLLKMCLVHDLPEARTGDANAVHKMYVTMDEVSAVADLVEGLPGGEKIRDLLDDYRAGETIEALLAHDADQLDMLLSLKEHMDTGSKDAREWIPHVKARLKTDAARQLADAVLGGHWAAWWMKKLLKEESRQGGR